MRYPRSPVEFREEWIEFLGEQDGGPERELKAELQTYFLKSASIQRAYLAIVRYTGKPGSNVSLCLVIDPNHYQEVLINIGEIFSKMFNSNEYLDIIALNDNQEQRLLAVCQPFFVNELGGNGGQNS